MRMIPVLVLKRQDGAIYIYIYAACWGIYVRTIYIDNSVCVIMGKGDKGHKTKASTQTSALL